MNPKATMIPTTFAIQAEDIHDQVDRIIASPVLEHSPRLKELFEYIVNEFIAGRAERIKGFSIGEAIYSSGDRFDSESNSIVRVEVGRLRQRLTEYYQTSGRADPVIIDIPKGSYVPRFAQNPQAPGKSEPSLSFRCLELAFNGRWLIVGMLGLAIFLLLNWRYFDVPEHSITEELNRDKGQQYLHKSEAQILFRQAFVLLMPPADRTRLTTSLELFQRAIEIDSNFAGGYAGKSVALSFGIIFAHSEYPSADLRQALILAKSASDIDPEYPFGYAAMALAQSLNGETDSALANVRRVLSIQPPQANANAIAAVALITSGEPSRAIDLLNTALELNQDESRTPFLNLIGVAQYVNGNFSAAAESIELNQAHNGPTGPHMEVFLAAAYAQMGKDFEAQAIIEKLQRTNPEYPVERWLGNFINSEDEIEAIMSKLQLLGLPRS